MAAGSSAQLELELLVGMLSVLCPSWVCGGLWVVLAPWCRNETRKYHGGGGGALAMLPMTTAFNWTDSNNECGLGDIPSFLQLCSISLVVGHTEESGQESTELELARRSHRTRCQEVESPEYGLKIQFLQFLPIWYEPPARALKSQGLHFLYAKWR